MLIGTDWRFAWEQTKQRFEAWWNGDLTETPLMYLVMEKEKPEPPEPVNWPDADGFRGRYTDVDALIANFRNYARAYDFAMDACPGLNMNLGPGSLALYLGCEPFFAEDTVWYKECVHESWEGRPLVFDKDNYWWKLHYEMFKKAQAELRGEFLVNIPDLIENIDIIASMRGATNVCYDLLDEPEVTRQRLAELDDLYFQYYDPLYDLVKDENGGSSYTAFQIWGAGKTGKVQCDFSAVMSPEQFREFVKPSLEKQCAGLDYSLYHLDGPAAVKHLPALMEIGPLRALQWTAGAGQPDGANEKWYPIYDKAREAGKSLWVNLGEDEGADVLIEKARRFVKRYGVGGLYLLFPVVSRQTGQRVLAAAAKGFK